MLHAGCIGGANSDQGFGIAVDGAGNAYVTGANETTFPVTVGPDLTFNGGFADAFVAKIQATPPNTMPVALCRNVTVKSPQNLITDLTAQINALASGGQLAASKANPLITNLHEKSAHPAILL